MTLTQHPALRSGLLSVLLLGLLLVVWQLATGSGPAAAPTVQMTPEEIEYAKLLGKDPTGGGGGVQKSGFPTLAQMASAIGTQLASPFYDNGPNDKGIGIQLAYSLGRVALG